MRRIAAAFLVCVFAASGATAQVAPAVTAIRAGRLIDVGAECPVVREMAVVAGVVGMSHAYASW